MSEYTLPITNEQRAEITAKLIEFRTYILKHKTAECVNDGVEFSKLSKMSDGDLLNELDDHQDECFPTVPYRSDERDDKLMELVRYEYELNWSSMSFVIDYLFEIYNESYTDEELDKALERWKD